jgi:hypothetical protein
VDSAGIRVLFDLRESLRNRGQEIRLVVPPDAEILDALRIAFVPRVVGVFESLGAATESIADKARPGH